MSLHTPKLDTLNPVMPPPRIPIYANRLAHAKSTHHTPTFPRLLLLLPAGTRTTAPHRSITTTTTTLYAPTTTTSIPPSSSIRPQSPNRLPSDLLARRPASARPLPSLTSLNPSRRWLKTLPIFIAIITASALGIFNYQKVNSPIISANLYALRTNSSVRELLGDEVYFASRWAWVSGEINLVQGRVDVRFNVKGKKGVVGTTRFRARRFGGRNGEWRTEEWSLRVPMEGESERIVELLDQGAVDPMAGA